MSVERKLAEGMGYEYCVPFSRARVAIAYYVFSQKPDWPIFIPSNVCPALAQAIGPSVRFAPVNAETGTTHPIGGINVNLYGYRSAAYSELEIDPMMTGWRRSKKSRSAVISFGYSKTIDLGEGAAFFTDDLSIYAEMIKHADCFLPDGLEAELDRLPQNIAGRKERAALWDKHLGDCCIKPPVEQVIPWRVIRRVPYQRDNVVSALRASGFYAATNYPPLPGVTDPSAVQWGNQVINLWVTPDYDEQRIIKACDIIKRTIGQ